MKATKHVYLILLSICFGWLVLNGQSKVDTLHLKLDSAISDVEKAAAYLALGDYYIQQVKDSAGLYYDLARKTIPLTGADSLYIKIYERSSIYFEQKGMNREALQHAHQAWTRVKQSGRSREVDQMYILLGRFHHLSTTYDSALYYFTALLESKKMKQDSYYLWLPNKYLAQLYSDMHEWEKSLPYWEEALRILRTEKRPKDYLYFLYVYFNSAESLGDFDRYALVRNEYLTYKQDNKQNILDAEHSMLADPSLTPADRRKKIMTYLPLYEKHRGFASLCESYYRLGQSYLEEKKYDQAASAYDKMLVYADSLNSPMTKYNAHLAIYKAQHAQQNFEQALYHYEMMFNLRDTILSQEKTKNMEDLRIQYETAEKEKQLAESNLALVASTKQKQLFGFGFVGSLLILGLTTYAFTLKRKSNVQLEEKNKMISKALEEKDILLREIHHRVKNNLQMISALLYLHGKSVDDASAQEALMESQNRVQSMAIIHQNLYQHENLLGVSVQDYLDKLIQHLISSYNIEQNRIRVVKQIDLPQLDIDTVIPLALIINELVSNAFKYAFQDGREGEILIRLEESDQGLELEIRDNGPGLPPAFSTETSANFGLRLIQILCDRLGATWQIQSANGTRVIMSVPRKMAA